MDAEGTTMDGSGNKKLQELILYIARRSEGDEPFGQTKLNKILFYSDFIAYAKRGHSITGQQYRKVVHGPEPTDVLQAIAALQEQDALAIARLEYHGLPHQRPTPLREPELSVFSAEEISIVEHVISELWGRSARDVRDLSHDFIGWRAARYGELIPYETMFLSSRELTEREYQRGAELEPVVAA
jgi:hypothetical protein